MGQRKKHLAGRHSHVSRAACGLKNPRHWTHDPAQVTCRGCAKTIQMADAELAQPKRSN